MSADVTIPITLAVVVDEWGGAQLEATIGDGPTVAIIRDESTHRSAVPTDRACRLLNDLADVIEAVRRMRASA